MKRTLLSVLFSLILLIGLSQTTKTRLSDADESWNNAAAWSPMGVPASNDVVIVPSGVGLNVNVSVTVSTINVQSGGTLFINNTLQTTGNSNFDSGSMVIWNSGTISGGGTVTNAGVLSLATTNNKSISGSTQINNQGFITIDSSGDLLISDGIVTNEASGELALNADAGNISWSGGSEHILNNSGIIRRAVTSGEAQIHVILNNNGGTISVETGTLSFQNTIGKNFTNGEYNVSAGASLDWDSWMNLEGTLTGVIDGALNWNDRVTVAFEETASLDFTGSGNVNWNSSGLYGGGTLNNLSDLRLTTTANKSITENSILNNEGNLIIESSGDLLISNGNVNNQASGVLEMQSDAGNISWSGTGTHVLNNYGVITRTTSIGEAQIVAELNNYNGVISVESGVLSFQNTIGKYLEDGQYNVSNGATFDWDGTVTLSGDLTGTVDGNLNRNGTVIVEELNQASFDFDGSGGVNWNSGNSAGGGTFTNHSELNLTSTANKQITENTVFINNGTVNIQSSGDLHIVNGEFNNAENGILDLQANVGDISWSGGTTHLLYNSGTIKATAPGLVSIVVEMYNTGTIQVESGTLALTNSIGKHLQSGVYNIFEEASLNWAGVIYPTGILTGVINGELNWNNMVSIPSTESATFDFEGSGNFNWNGSNLQGGGTLNNLSILNLDQTANKSILENSVLNNDGTIRIVNSGDLLITNGEVNNNPLGTMELNSDAGNVTWSGGTMHILNNSGIIKKASGGNVLLDAELYNSGIIQVEEGQLALSSSIGKFLEGGEYNVFPLSQLNWTGLILPTGNLTGQVDGDLNWSNTVEIPVGSEAIFNFSGIGNVNWSASNLRGGGKLINQSELNLTTTANKSIIEDSIFENQGLVNIASSGDLLISQGVFENTPSGILDLQVNAGNVSYSGGTSHLLNNSGLIRKSGQTGTVIIYGEVTNSGLISAEAGLLNIEESFNGSAGVLGGTATIELPSNHVYTGTIDPGISANGTLTYKNDYFSDNSAVIFSEIIGYTPNTEYDVLTIDGDAEFSGGVEISLSFEPAINDEFTIVNTTGTINDCSLFPQATYYYLGNLYTFGVTCNTNQVKLMLDEVTFYAGTGDYNFDGEITAQDLTGFLSEFGTSGTLLIGDFNFDGEITAGDLTSFLTVFGTVY